MNQWSTYQVDRRVGNASCFLAILVYVVDDEIDLHKRSTTYPQGWARGGAGSAEGNISNLTMAAYV
jgi:hypothetical protein